MHTDPHVSRKYGGTLLCWQYEARVHVYQLSEEGAADDDEGEDGVPSYREWILPCRWVLARPANRMPGSP